LCFLGLLILLIRLLFVRLLGFDLPLNRE
jgi:hypothetical protein